MKPFLLIVLSATLCAGVLVTDVAGRRGKAKHFQLVYQSDTRGWYSPCG